MGKQGKVQLGATRKQREKRQRNNATLPDCVGSRRDRVDERVKYWRALALLTPMPSMISRGIATPPSLLRRGARLRVSG